MPNEIAVSSDAWDSLDFDQLLLLRERLDALIAQRVGAEEKELEERLARIKRLKERPSLAAKNETSVKNGRKLPPLYRNPENPTQTWAGRGLKPRWLTQGLRSGKKMSHFQIANNK